MEYSRDRMGRLQATCQLLTLGVEGNPVIDQVGDRRAGAVDQCPDRRAVGDFSPDVDGVAVVLLGRIIDSDRSGDPALGVIGIGFVGARLGDNEDSQMRCRRQCRNQARQTRSDDQKIAFELALGRRRRLVVSQRRGVREGIC